MKIPRIFFLVAAFLPCGVVLAQAKAAQTDESDDALVEGFKNPPREARPLTWWHWVSGFATKEGITADLESMKRVGLGGAQMFSVAMNMKGPDGKELRGPIVFNSPEWRELVRHAIAESHRLGLEFSMMQAAGWGQAGGETVTPDQTMLMTVWTEEQVKGGQKVALKLPQPDTRLNFYKDVALLAFPSVKGDEVTAKPKLTSSFGGELNLGDGPATFAMPMPDAPQWVQLEFDQDQTFSSLNIDLLQMRDTPDPAAWDQSSYLDEAGKKLVREAKGPMYWVLQVSEDGKRFRDVGRVSTHGTSSFPEATGKRFRVWMPVPPPLSRPLPLARSEVVKLKEIELAGPRVDKVEARIGRIADRSTVDFSIFPVPPEGVVAADRVIDLTGKAEWDAPPGNWTLVRFGYTSTEGHLAAAGSQKALEADKMSRQAILDHLTKGVTTAVINDNREYVGNTFKNLLCDSWERGDANWTPLMKEEFRKRRGYAMDPWLPTLTGRIVNSPEQSERFLWDFRRTIADLIAENYYGTLDEFAHQHHMNVYAEAAGHGLPGVVDQISNKANTDIPMGEFWLERRDIDDTKEASSAAHVYGKTIAAAESFTAIPSVAGWTRDPASLKSDGDLQFCMGINRYCLHRFTHQALMDKMPGLTMGQWGSNFDRTNTWWENGGKAWLTYVSRCQFLLQQGHFVADVIYYYGEGTPVGVSLHDLAPAPPRGYDFDVCNTDVLEKMTVEDGMVVAPSGLKYRVLVLPDKDRMTPGVAEKVRDLVKAGATVVGPRPLSSPSLSNFPQCDQIVKAIGEEVWGDCDGKAVTSHVYGKGAVKWGVPLQGLLGVPPDFTSGPADFRYIHRRDGAVDIYFLSNQGGIETTVDCAFRVSGKGPELWHPMRGKIESEAQYVIKDGATTMPVHLDKDGSVFVVFRGTASADPIASVTSEIEGAKRDGVPENRPPILEDGKVTLTAWQPGRYTFTTAKGETKSATTGAIPEPMEIAGAWDLHFPPKLGAPATAVFEKLDSWTNSGEEGIKYFSGTATYTKIFSMPKDRLREGARFSLDLGKVMNVAEVTVNGINLGVLWKAPFRADVTKALKAGENTLEIKVTNLWPNRMIGDMFLPVDQRITWASFNPYTKESKLLESGLLGPVTVQAGQNVQVTP